MKKIISIVLSFFIALTLISCTKTTTVTTTKTTTTSSNGNTYVLPDLTGYSTSEIKELLDQVEGLNYQLVVKDGLLYGEEEGMYEYEMFYGYAGKTNVPGLEFDLKKKLNVNVTAYNIPDSFDELKTLYPELSSKLDQVTLSGKVYENKSFAETGLGEVKVMGYVDGDTTRFKDNNGEVFSLRYLGIDTPESTASFEPWGKAASAYTENALSTAKKVVLESDVPNQKDNNGRRLGWVWYQDQSDEWHLLNLELITFCYTKDKASSESVYGDLCTDIGVLVGQSHRRVWGENDPEFDYSTDPKVITLEELRTNFGFYYSRKVQVTGVIAMVDGKSIVVVDPVTNYGIYFYIPSWTQEGTWMCEVGNEVTVTGVATYYGIGEEDLDSMDEDLGKGSPQLTDFKKGCIEIVSENNEVTPVEVSVNELNSSKCGMYITLNNLTVTRVWVASTGSGTTIYCTDENGDEISIRVDDSHYFIKDTQEDGVDVTSFHVNDKITSVTGYLSYYAGYQVNLISNNYINK